MIEETNFGQSLWIGTVIRIRIFLIKNFGNMREYEKMKLFVKSKCLCDRRLYDFVEFTNI